MIQLNLDIFSMKGIFSLGWLCLLLAALHHGEGVLLALLALLSPIHCPLYSMRALYRLMSVHRKEPCGELWDAGDFFAARLITS